MPYGDSDNSYPCFLIYSKDNTYTPAHTHTHTPVLLYLCCHRRFNLLFWALSIALPIWQFSAHLTLSVIYIVHICIKTYHSPIHPSTHPLSYSLDSFRFVSIRFESHGSLLRGSVLCVSYASLTCRSYYRARVLRGCCCCANNSSSSCLEYLSASIRNILFIHFAYIYI